MTSFISDDFDVSLIGRQKQLTKHHALWYETLKFKHMGQQPVTEKGDIIFGIYDNKRL